MKKLLSFILCTLIVFSMLPAFNLSASALSVEKLYGSNTVFYAAFGKVSYNGETYNAFRNFDEAYNAIVSAGGGNIVFSGDIDLSSFTDKVGRAPIKLIGAINGENQNCINFGEATEFSLGGDLTLYGVTIRSQSTVNIKTDGNRFNAEKNIYVGSTQVYVPGGKNYLKYDPSSNISVGANGTANNAVILHSGQFDTVTAGSVSGEALDTVTSFNIGGDTIITKLFAGNSGAGSSVGTTVKVEDASVTELYVGSTAGSVAGDITVSVNNGNIGTLFVGASNGSIVNGNIVIELSGNSTVGAYTTLGKISGKTILVLKNGFDALIPDGIFDYIISINEGKAVYTNGGFVFKDTSGMTPASVKINNVDAAPANSVYQLAQGTSRVEIPLALTPIVRKNAKYVSGYEDGTFLPQNNITRAEAITLLSKIIETNERIIGGNITSDYIDVPNGAWYEPYIGFFEALGYLDGIDKTGGINIYPTQPITRGEFVQLVFEISALSQRETSVKLTTLPDVASDTPNAQAILYAVAAGIVTGYEDGTFRPEGLITRAEVVTIVNRFLERIPTGNADGMYFYDTQSHWANSQILAACGGEGVSWNSKVMEQDAKYVMPGTNTKENVIALYTQSKNLSGDAIREGVDMVAEQIKKNVIDSPDLLEPTIKGTKYYVSSINGNNKNDGLSPETAFKNLTGLKKAKLEYGDGVFFERGGVYRGYIDVVSGVTYAAYGSGHKPVITQSRRNYASEALWNEVEGYPNVWKLILSVDNVGVIAFDHDMFEYGNYNELYGDIMNYNTFGFMGIEDFTQDLQFYSNTSSGELYVYSDKGNPGTRFSSIEIGERQHIFQGRADNVHLDNLSVMYTGAHGIGLGGGSTDRKVTNCTFSWLGGSVLYRRETGEAVNFGNAIEAYGGIDGYYVENNWIWQIYDTGITHQFSSSGEGDCTHTNIRYYGNLVEYVYWGIEVYNSPKAGTNRKTTDVHISHNVLRRGGEGWGCYTRFREDKAPLYHVYSLSQNSDELVEYNIFDRSLGDLINVTDVSKEVDDKNIYIQFEGKQLGVLKGTRTVCGYDSLANINDFFRDKNAVFVVVKKTV